ncbi:MAG: hypothetical protein KBC33_01900 [Candidatus Pacebacteria bacterium]|nr:hypothetical protein [Candidatus Paceibacterota bacterium]
MNDDLLTPKSQPIPVEPNTTPAPNDTEEQDTVSDRVYDFTDGDIKPVSDLDGPVTHKVNLEIAEALRNPGAIMNSMKTGTPVAVPRPIQTPTPTRAPINKLEPIPTPPVSSTPKPIPHPPIDPAMQAPAVKVYSQVPHAPTQAPASTASVQTPPPTTTSAQSIPSSYKPSGTSQQPTKFVTEASSTPKLPVQPAIPSTQKVPESPASAAALQAILRKVHSQTQAAPPTIKENLLDKNIGSLQATPFATPTVTSNPTPSVPPTTTSATSLGTPPPVNIPSSVAKPRTTPFNPPSKVIGARLSDYTADPVVQPKPTSLQDAVGSVLPGDKPDAPKPFQNQNGPFKPMRTYEGDVAEAMSHRRISTASIAIAETKKVQGEERISDDSGPKKDSRTLLKIVMTLLIIILLGGGVFAGYYLYSKSPLATSISNTPVQQQGRPGIVRADSYAVIPIDNQLPATLLSRIQAEVAKAQTPGTIKEIILARKTASSNTATFTQIGAPEAISGLDISVPDILNRTITADWMLGVYTNSAQEKGVFAIVTTNFFQNAFAGMLQWEATIADDLKQFIYPSDSTGIANTRVATVATTSSPTINLDSLLPSLVPSSTTTITLNSTTTPSGATSTASSTIVEVVAPLRPYFTLRGTFEDRIIKNKDVRAFRIENGTILFLYSFIDNTHLALASDEATLIEVLTRLERQAQIR